MLPLRSRLCRCPPPSEAQRPSERTRESGHESVVMNLRVDPKDDALNDLNEIESPSLTGEEQRVASAGEASHGGATPTGTADALDKAAASTNRNRIRRRRWAISAAVVLLVHGVFVAAALRWRESLPFGPIVIKLAPAPEVSVAPPSDLPPEQGRPSAVPEKPVDKAEKTPAGGDEKPGQKPSEEPRVTTLPPAAGEGENRPETGAAPGGGVPAAKPGGSVTGPIDLVVPQPNRLAEQKRLLEKQHRLRFGKAARAKGGKGPVIGAPSNVARPLSSFAGGQSRGAGAPGGGTVRNAIGMPVQVPAGARGGNGVPGTGQSSPSLTGAARNAIGIPTGLAKNTVAAPAGSPVQGTTTKPIGPGAAAQPSSLGASHPGGLGSNHPTLGANHPNATGTNAHSSASSPVGVPGTAINGTGMTRPGTRTGVVGGAAKNSPGVLNGTSFRSRQP
jgi:hypothetical protein